MGVAAGEDKDAVRLCTYSTSCSLVTATFQGLPPTTGSTCADQNAPLALTHSRLPVRVQQLRLCLSRLLRAPHVAHARQSQPCKSHPAAVLTRLSRVRTTRR